MNELETPLDEQVERVEEPSTEQRLDAFARDLESLINSHSIENLFDVPDFILAQYIRDHLCVLAAMSRRRDEWFDFTPFGENGARKKLFSFEVRNSSHTTFYIQHNLGCSTVNIELYDNEGTEIIPVSLRVLIAHDFANDNATVLNLSEPIPQLARIIVREA